MILSVLLSVKLAWHNCHFGYKCRNESWFCVEDVKVVERNRTSVWQHIVCEKPAPISTLVSYKILCTEGVYSFIKWILHSKLYCRTLMHHICIEIGVLRTRSVVKLTYGSFDNLHIFCAKLNHFETCVENSYYVETTTFQH